MFEDINVDRMKGDAQQNCRCAGDFCEAPAATRKKPEKVNTRLSNKQQQKS